MKKVVLHMKEKRCLFDADGIWAVLPAEKGKGSIICVSPTEFLPVDEPVDVVEDLIDEANIEVEIVNDDEAPSL